MHKYPQIAGRLFNTPLMIHPGKLDAILYGLSSRLGVDYPKPAPGLYTTDVGQKKEPGYRIIGNVGVIDLFGVLVHRGGLQADSSYLLGYQEVSRMLASALADNSVDRIVINADTPGGEVSGAFDLADEVYRARSVKPVDAIASDMAVSAGYLIASACEHVYLTRTACVGSIGVVTRHVDMSRMYDMAGVNITHIFAGAHKVDGNPYEALPDDVRENMQASIDAVYDLFVQRVATYRGMDEQAIRDTEAQVYMGLEAVAVGLADGITTPNKLISRRQAESSTGAATHLNTPQEQTAMTVETVDRQDGEAAAVESTSLTAEKASTIRAEARQAERARIQGILGHESAQGCTELANHLAFETSMDVESATAMMAKAPRVVEATLDSRPDTGFEAAMAAVENPDIGPGGEPQSDDATALAASILAFK